MDPISFPVSLTRRERTLGAGYYLAQVTVLPLLMVAILENELLLEVLR